MYSIRTKNSLCGMRLPDGHPLYMCRIKLTTSEIKCKQKILYRQISSDTQSENCKNRDKIYTSTKHIHDAHFPGTDSQ